MKKFSSILLFNLARYPAVKDDFRSSRTMRIGWCEVRISLPLPSVPNVACIDFQDVIPAKRNDDIPILEAPQCLPLSCLHFVQFNWKNRHQTLPTLNQPHLILNAESVQHYMLRISNESETFQARHRFFRKYLHSITCTG